MTVVELIRYLENIDDNRDVLVVADTDCADGDVCTITQVGFSAYLNAVEIKIETTNEDGR